MKCGIILGRVICTQKYETLEGKRLLLLQPTDWDRKPQGEPIVAADAVGAGSREFVAYVAAREAAVAHPDLPPVDATIVAILDGVDWRLRDPEKIQAL